MKTVLILVLLLPLLAAAQEFTFRQEIDTIPVEIDGWRPYCPWVGGEMESAPETCDLDGDGDLDLFIGNLAGRITHYRNTGSGLQATFDFVTPQFAQIDLGGLPFGGRTAPAFCDLDADGDQDLLSGDFFGLLHYWENVGTGQQAQYQLISDTLQGIDVTGYSQMDFQDLEADGDYDLLIGTYQGDLWLYRNQGTAAASQFVLETALFLGVDVGQNATPTFCDIDADSDLDLFIGEQYGRIWYYRNDGTAQQYQFTYVTNNYAGIDVGDYASPEFADLDSDGDFDLLVGREPPSGASTAGDVFYYENQGTPQLPQFHPITANYLSVDEGDISNIDLADIDADGDADLFLTGDEVLRFYRNTGTAQNPAFTKESENFQDIFVNDVAPFFCDIDGDGDLDLFCGTGAFGSPGLHLYLNRGTPQQPDLRLYSEDLVAGEFETYILPALADIDADGDQDLFLCDQGDHFFFYRNQGSAQWPNFVQESANWQGIYPGITQHPFRFWDIDGDGDLDFFMGSTVNVSFYRNVGTPRNASLVWDDSLLVESMPYSPMDFAWADIDAEGDGDLFISTGVGGCFFFRNTTGDTTYSPYCKPRIQRQIDLSLSPQPGNPTTSISFQLPYAQEVDLAVYNLLGARVATLASGKMEAGNHALSWEAKGLASGVYVVRLQAGDITQTQKLVLLK